MKKLFKSNLDEMKEKKIKTYESRNLWVLTWALLIVIIYQSVMGKDFDAIKGEVIVLLLSCVYMMYYSMKLNVWSSFFKPSLKSNLLLSLIGGFVGGVIAILRILLAGHEIILQYFLIPCATTFILTFALLSFTSFFFIKKEKELENSNDE